MNDAETWERQPGESAPAFEAFATYRDTEPGQRSHRRVAQQLGKSRTLIGRWMDTHRWVERVRAFDGEQDRVWLLEVQYQRRLAAKRHMAMARLAQGKITQALQALDADKITVSELTRLLDVSVRIERDALGEPLKHEVSGPAGEPLTMQLAEFQQMPPEHRRAAIAELVASVARRAAAINRTDDDSE